MSHQSALKNRDIDLVGLAPSMRDTQVIERGRQTQVIETGPIHAGDGSATGPDTAGSTAVDRDRAADTRNDDGVAARPRRGFGGPFGAVMALVISAAVVTLAAVGRSWSVDPDVRLLSALRDGLDPTVPRSIPAWWGVVLFTLTAVWCWAAAGRARLSRRWLRFLLWGLLGLVVVAMSLSNLLDLRGQVTDIAAFRRWGLPHYVVAHPWETAVVATLTVPVVILLIGASSTARMFLFHGLALYLVGSLVVGGGAWRFSQQAASQQVAVVAFEWCGMALLMLAAGLERVTVRPPRD